MAAGVMPVMAAVSAGVAGYCAFSLAEARYRRNLHARASLQGRVAGGPLWWVRNGVKPLVSLARWLLRFPAVDAPMAEAVRLAERRGVAAAPESLLSALLAGGLGLGFAASLVAGSPVFAVAAVALAAIFFGNRMNASRDARVAALRQQTPEALRALGVCSKSGLSLSQTMDTLAGDLEQPIARLFEQASRRMKVGAPAQEALAVFSEGGSSAELSFVAVALDVQHQTGGSLSQVLESARESVRDELELRRTSRVQTAQAQLSARIVTCMPFVLVALFSLITEDFMGPFFQSVQGIALLTLALVMQGAGVLAVRGLLRHEEGRP